MTSRRLLVVALLGATILLSGCTPGQPTITGPSTTPAGPATTMPSIPATSTTSPSPTGPATVAPTTTPDAWAALHAAQQGCPTTPWVPTVHTGLGLLFAVFASVSDCAVFVTRSDIPLGVWTQDELFTFPSMPEPADVSSSSSVVPFTDGFWLATYDTSDPNGPSVAALWSERQDHAVRVSLPSDFCGFEALSPHGTGLLVAGDTGNCGESNNTTDSALYLIGADDRATLLNAFPEARVYSTGSDGTNIAAAGITMTGQAFVAAWYGQEWVQSTLGPAGRIAGVTIRGDTIVTVYDEQDSNYIPVAQVTAISHDRGQTWTTTRVPKGSSGWGVLGYLGGTLMAQLDLPDSTAWLYTLTPSDTWEPLKDAPEFTPLDFASVALAPCGYWTYQGSTYTLSYHTVPGACTG